MGLNQLRADQFARKTNAIKRALLKLRRQLDQIFNFGDHAPIAVTMNYAAGEIDQFQIVRVGQQGWALEIFTQSNRSVTKRLSRLQSASERNGAFAFHIRR